MQANLISNYALIRKYAPVMKQHGRGSVLNVSSYFGGEKYVAVAYPNRADYAVSKAGQRVLAEIMSRHLGPEIQINALAPGPVDGARLRGLGNAPGLFERRGRLVLENKRLNAVHAAVLAALDEGMSSQELLAALARNQLTGIRANRALAKSMTRLLASVEKGRDGGNSAAWLLNRGLADKLVNRLVTGGLVTPDAAAAYLEAFEDCPQEFFAIEAVRRAAESIEVGILNRLHLHKMPTDEQIGLSTVFHLADEIVSGETFHPSGGLKFDRSVTEGELLLRPDKESLDRLAGKRVVLLGDPMREEMAAIAGGFIAHGVSRLTVLTQSSAAAEELRHSIDPGAVEFDAVAIGDDIEEALDDLLQHKGGFDVVVSAPFARLPFNALAAEGDGHWGRVLSQEGFAKLVEDQLTHHFRVARRAALVPGCQIVLLTPDTSFVSSREEFALALFVKNALHAFTVTLGVETERLPTTPAVNQVQLTRRARSEEPATEQELEEEMERLVYAVLQCAVPAPSPSESRYLARIFRGNAVTV
jgi:malonyl-CoA reductase/3-hydroxypropionate dehydrogenase (NADP+)